MVATASGWWSCSTRDADVHGVIGPPPGLDAPAREVAGWRDAARAYVAVEQQHGQDFDLIDSTLTRELDQRVAQLQQLRAGGDTPGFTLGGMR